MKKSHLQLTFNVIEMTNLVRCILL